MNPDFGLDVDFDILQLWDSHSSMNSLNNNNINDYFSTSDFAMNNFLPQQSEVNFQFQENFLPSVETSNTILPSSFAHLPVRPVRKRTLKKLSFSSNSDSSLVSSDYSSEESFVPSRTPPPPKPQQRQQQKRSPRSKTAPIIKKQSTPPRPRGRGRPKKNDDDVDDDKLIHKRQYARAYREQHQQAVKNFQQCAVDFYNTLIANGVDVKRKFPQHSKVIQNLIEKMPAVKSTTSRKGGRRRY
uniref:Uncharacterized protein n=1 Tax=Panagrolaimus sp. PS1159 TaxID=55785 RepID=A0AC35FGB8_9BILA